MRWSAAAFRFVYSYGKMLKLEKEIMVDAAEPHQKLTRHGQVLPETITGKELGWKPSNNNEGNCMILSAIVGIVMNYSSLPQNYFCL